MLTLTEKVVLGVSGVGGPQKLGRRERQEALMSENSGRKGVNAQDGETSLQLLNARLQ